MRKSWARARREVRCRARRWPGPCIAGPPAAPAAPRPAPRRGPGANFERTASARTPRFESLVAGLHQLSSAGAPPKATTSRRRLSRPSAFALQSYRIEAWQSTPRKTASTCTLGQPPRANAAGLRVPRGEHKRPEPSTPSCNAQAKHASRGGGGDLTSPGGRLPEPAVRWMVWPHLTNPSRISVTTASVLRGLSRMHPQALAPTAWRGGRPRISKHEACAPARRLAGRLAARAAASAAAGPPSAPSSPRLGRRTAVRAPRHGAAGGHGGGGGGARPPRAASLGGPAAPSTAARLARPGDKRCIGRGRRGAGGMPRGAEPPGT
mmetsp:Transcript_85529/g.275952  ORF Transcript_85529/g.275952 Transcript_85529/m.275952 type:complete len:322 (-) Transcript_85529:1191-2156(-)